MDKIIITGVNSSLSFIQKTTYVWLDDVEFIVCQRSIGKKLEITKRMLVEAFARHGLVTASLAKQNWSKEGAGATSFHTLSNIVEVDIFSYETAYLDTILNLVEYHLSELIPEGVETVTSVAINSDKETEVLYDRMM